MVQKNALTSESPSPRIPKYLVGDHFPQESLFVNLSPGAVAVGRWGLGAVAVLVNIQVDPLEEPWVGMLGRRPLGFIICGWGGLGMAG